MQQPDKGYWFAAIGGQMLVGAAVGMVIFIAFLGFWIAPYLVGQVRPTESVQVGPRGTGLQQIEFADENADQVAENIMPVSEDPIPPAPDSALARDVYENVQVLGDLTEDNFNRLMIAITEWVSPEQGCAYCHGEEGNFASDDYYPKVVARRMIQMTQSINADWSEHVAPSGVTCYTCHRGRNVPQYIWFSPVPHPAMGPSAMYQNRATSITGSASLPADAIESYLMNAEVIAVTGGAPRESNVGTASIQHTEKTFSLMIHMSNALGVGCTYCHNSRAFAEWDQSAPTRLKAQLAIGMLQSVNAEYLAPLAPTYPPHRLGPDGDAAKAACTTCHQGAAKPLLGQSMIGSWPELVSSPPVYQ